MSNRIIGGTAGGRALGVAASGTRPTSERAREALFNTLDTLLDLDGGRVLDLYAGSGAVGLEALSRGAASAVLVESDPSAALVIAANAAALGLTGAEVSRQPVRRFLAAPQGRPFDGPFDIVFADPPYDLPGAEVDAVLAALTGDSWLVPGSVVVVERAARGVAPAWPTPLAAIKQKRYGDTVLWYGRAMTGDA